MNTVSKSQRRMMAVACLAHPNRFELAIRQSRSAASQHSSLIRTSWILQAAAIRTSLTSHHIHTTDFGIWFQKAPERILAEHTTLMHQLLILFLLRLERHRQYLGLALVPTIEFGVSHCAVIDCLLA